MLGKYNRRTIMASTGAVAPEATVSFYWQANGTPVIVYADPEGNTPLGSSVQSDENGRIAVFATPGLYRIVVTSDGDVVDELTYEPIVGSMSYGDPDSYALRSELNLHDEDIQLVVKSVADAKLSGGPRLASGRALTETEIGIFADTGALLKTSEYHAGTSVGGGEYQIRMLASYRTEIGDGAWVPDGYADHYLLDGTTYVAVLIKRDRVLLEQFGVRAGVDCTAQIQAALDSGYPVTGRGVYTASAKLVIKGPFDGTNVTIEFTDSPPVALELSTGSAENPTDILDLTESTAVILPSIKNLGKVGTGWAGQGIGIRYVNVQNAQIVERLVQDFDIGVQHTSYSQGCGYNTVTGGYLRNNRVSRQITVGNDTGFTNRWDIVGGRNFHLTAEGTAVSGVMHVDVVPNATGNIINDFNFYGGSFEGVAEQYHARLGGAFINFYGSRWESTAGIKIHLAYNGIPGQGSSNSLIGGRGLNAATISITADAGNPSPRLRVDSTTGQSILSVPSPQILRNSNSGSEPFLVAYSATTEYLSADHTTQYSLSMSAQNLRGKQETDVSPRTEIDFTSGAIKVGNGSLAPTAGIQSLGSVGVQITGNLYHGNTVTPPANVAGKAAFWFDEAAGEFKFRRPDGTVRTITSS